MEDLPNEFDLVIIGTGMPECILAAAAARVGKSVLHLDRNNYYGGEWASFNYDQLLNWIEEKKSCESFERTIEPSWLELTGEEEQLIACVKDSATITNVVQKICIREKADTNLEALASGDNSDASEIVPPSNAVLDASGSVGDSGTVNVQEMSSVVLGDGDNNSENNNASAVSAAMDSLQCIPSNSANSVQEMDDIASLNASQTINTSESNAVQEQGMPSNSGTRTINSDTESGRDELDSNSAVSSVSPNVPVEVTSSSVPADQQETLPLQQKEWTLEDLKSKHRKFNIDISPKLLFAKGPLVELLISSNIARYAEFKCFTRVLTSINGHLEQVPCSRADVFSTKNVSVVEKRMLMKLLTLCMEYQNHPQEYRGFEGRPFIRFLRSKKLTPNIEHYVLHAIAMVDDSTPTLQGLQATQKFLQSLGRYGNSPFLWTCYGSAELPQCFCRLCAVFGGIYHLKRDADAVILDAENKCRGLISSGQRLNCQWLVMESSYAPIQFFPEESPDRLSRAIFITDRSILPAEKEQITLLRLPPVPAVRGAVTVLELGPSAYVCPDGLYIIHMVCRSSAATSFDDLKSAAEELFQPFEEGNEDVEQAFTMRPKVLWCLFYNQKDTNAIDLNSKVPTGILLTSSPDLEQDYEQAVHEAKDLFNKICPGEEFLPRAPDPEDIVLEGHSNPGESDDNQLAGPTEFIPEDAKIESQKEENDHLEGENDNLVGEIGHLDQEEKIDLEICKDASKSDDFSEI